MVWNTLRGKRHHLKSSRLGFLLALLVFTLVMILVQHTTTWNTISPLSVRQYEPGTKISRECEQFPGQERIRWDRFYFYQDPSTKKGLIWCKVPKAGSTALVRMFLRLAGAREGQESREAHHTLRTFYPQLSPQVMTRRLNATFKFLVVRHLFERILSAYRDKLESYERDLQFRKYGKHMVKRLVENRTFVEPTFPEFVTYLVETSPKLYNLHWMPISHMCAPCRIQYDAIVKMENFDKEIKVPLGQAGIHEDVGWAHSTGTNKSTIKRYFHQLSYTQIQKLYYIYRKDFVLFGYTTNNYFSLAAHETLKENTTLALK